MAGRWPLASLSRHMSFLLRILREKEREEKREREIFLFCKATSPIGLERQLMASLNFNYLLKMLVLNTVTLRVRAST